MAIGNMQLMQECCTWKQQERNTAKEKEEEGKHTIENIWKEVKWAWKK